MTREQEAFEASKRFEISLTESDIASLSRSDMYFAFQLGIKWADSHPIEHWISVEDDLPCNHNNLLVKCLPYNSKLTKPVLALVADGSYQVCSMFINEGNKWEWSCNDVVLYWFQIPELPKE